MQMTDVLSGYRWTCSKSVNTCAACLSRDGEVYQVEQQMEVHVNCRCFMTPLVKGVDIKIESGADWFAKQPEKVQDAVLGKTGGKGYRAGDVKLDDFVRLHHDQKWGDSYQQVSFVQASQNAEGAKRAA